MRLIYVLLHPDTNIPFYVGQSRRGLSRPRCHWSGSYLLRDTNRRKKKQIMDILEAGKIPEIRVLATAETDNELNELEIYWISKYRKKYPALTNIADGGDAPTIEMCRMGGIAAAATGVCFTNNLKLRKPILATNLTTGEERWYLSACHASADGIGSRSAIANCLRPDWKWKVNKGWKYHYIDTTTQ